MKKVGDILYYWNLYVPNENKDDWVMSTVYLNEVKDTTPICLYYDAYGSKPLVGLDGNVGGEDIDISGYDVYSLGMVYGNANGDFTIDALDVEIVEKLVKRKNPSDVNKFPLADTDHDGKVTSADLDVVKALVAKTAIAVDVIDFRGTPITVSYPITDIFGCGGTNMRSVVSVLDLADTMSVWALASKSDTRSPVLDKALCDGINDGSIDTVTTAATDGDYQKLLTCDFNVALIEGNGLSDGYTSDAGRQFFEDYGADVLIYNTDDFTTLSTTIATLGILSGSEDQAKKYVEFTDKVQNTIDSKLGDKKGTATVMTVTMSNSVSGTLSDYYALSVLAGGKNLADWEAKTRKYNESEDPWLLDEKYNPDFMFHFKSMTYGTTEPSQKDIDTYKGYFKNTYAFINGNYYLINGVVPIPIRLAIMAEIMYPEIFDEGWATSLFQEYVDNFTTAEDWDVSEHKAIWPVE
jgi:ABC-type Fe3+-hydroxamate transport system substrate-binding protein